MTPTPASFRRPATWLPMVRSYWAAVSPPMRRMLVVSVGVGLVAGASLPFLAVYMTGRYGLSPSLLGTLYLGLGLLVLPAQFASGHFSDRVGRRRMLLMAAGVGLISSAALALAPSLYVAIPAFLLFGVAPGMWMPAYRAVMADLSVPEARSRAFALPYAAVGAGFTIGPLLGGFVAGWSYTALYLGVAVLFALIAIFVAVALPETRPHREKGATAPSGRHVWQDRRFLALAALIMATWLIFGQIDLTVPLWVIHQLHYPNALFGLMMALNGLLVALGQIGLNSLSARKRASSALALGAACIALGFGLLAIPVAPVLVAGTVVFTLGEMLVVPTFNGALASLAPPDRRGQYQGGGSLMQGIGFALGPLIGGAIYQRWGGQSLWGLCLLWGLLCAGGFVLFGRWQPLEVHDPMGDAAKVEATSANAAV